MEAAAHEKQACCVTEQRERGRGRQEGEREGRRGRQERAGEREIDRERETHEKDMNILTLVVVCLEKSNITCGYARGEERDGDRGRKPQYTHIHTYIHTHAQREREREREIIRVVFVTRTPVPG